MKGSLRNRIYTKIYSRWIKDFNVRPEIIQLLEKNISRTIFEINCSNNFWGLSPKAKETKTKINEWDLTKRKTFCIAKETVNKMKRQPTEWEKIFANDMTDKELISKIYKQLKNSILKKPKQLD